MNSDHNIFISWSGKRSLKVAHALHGWLPKILQVAAPWMSDADIDKGSRGLNEISAALEGMRVGITCLTPENLEAPWLLFEAGALSKSISDATRLCTYLIGGLQSMDIAPPLSMFQATKADKEDTRKLIHTLNKALHHNAITETNLNELFDAMWPNFEKELSEIGEPDNNVEIKKSTVEDMVAEVLAWTRGEPQRRLELTSEIVSRFGGFQITAGPADSSQATKSALTEYVRGLIQRGFKKVAFPPGFEGLREAPAFQQAIAAFLDDDKVQQIVTKLDSLDDVVAASLTEALARALKGNAAKAEE